MVEIVVPVAFMVTVCVLVAMVCYYRYRSRYQVQLTVRETISSGQSLTGEVLEQLMAALQPQRNDLRRGVIWTAIGLATLAFALLVNEKEAVWPILGVSAFPFFVGIAYLSLWRLNGKVDS